MIDLPAHIDKEGWTVDDAKNHVLFKFHWDGVQRTFEKSCEIAQEIVDTLNNRDAIAAVVSPVVYGEEPPSILISGGNGGEHKQRGNPAFRKGSPNPYK